jgi:hypothetical protein
MPSAARFLTIACSTIAHSSLPNIFCILPFHTPWRIDFISATAYSCASKLERCIGRASRSIRHLLAHLRICIIRCILPLSLPIMEVHDSTAAASKRAQGAAVLDPLYRAHLCLHAKWARCGYASEVGPMLLTSLVNIVRTHMLQKILQQYSRTLRSAAHQPQDVLHPTPR